MTDDMRTAHLGFSIGDIGSYVAIAMLFGNALSFIFHLGFLHELGIGMNELPISITDHLLTIEMWLISVFFVLVFYFFLVTGKQLAIDDEDNASVFRLIIRIQTASVLICCILALIVGQYNNALKFLPVALVTLFAGWLLDRRMSWGTISFAVAITVVSVGFLITSFNLAGQVSAELISHSQRNLVEIKLDGGSSIYDARVLRAYEKGVLVLLSDGRVTFLLWSDLDSIEQETIYKLNATARS